MTTTSAPTAVQTAVSIILRELGRQPATVERLRGTLDLWRYRMSRAQVLAMLGQLQEIGTVREVGGMWEVVAA